MAVNKQVVIRPMMYLALTYDHRIIDGREAVTFFALSKKSSKTQLAYSLKCKSTLTDHLVRLET